MIPAEFHALGLLMVNFGLIFAILGALALAALAAWLRERWLKARAVIRLTEAEKETGALAAAVTCTLCRKDGTGRCSCEIDCGHGVCTGDRPTIRAAWTPGELAILRGERELEQ